MSSISNDIENIYNSRGSTWNKWDLHVHTPASVVNQYGQANDADTWKKYIYELEQLSPEIKVLGINDYFSLDGYEKLLYEKTKNNRLKNIELLLPVMELRISSYAGQADLRKINYHIIFSNELKPEEIKLFFLHKLPIEYKLEDGKVWRGGISSETELIEFGKAIKNATPENKRTNESELKIGFANAALPFETVQDVLKQTVFHNKIIQAIGLAEWDQMRWDEGGAGVKKHLINQAELIFTCSPSSEKYQEQINKLKEMQVNHKLLDCSDAHDYSTSEQPNKLGNVYSWIKADLSFRGLRRAMQRFDKRVQICKIGDVPPKLQTVRDFRSKYIQSIEIRKIKDSQLSEEWFDCLVPLNNDLVAIIGNQGNGKSALSDILGLCGNTKTKEFSFLNIEKFRDRERKASAFQATLLWEDGSPISKKLDEQISETELERVKYVPQSFFEAVTNETVVSDNGKFYQEIKKVIFSHIPDNKRFGKNNLDEIISFKTSNIKNRLQMFRNQIEDINQEVVKLEEECSEEEISKLQNAINEKNKDIINFDKEKPLEIAEPKESADANRKIESLRKEEERIDKEIREKNNNLKVFEKQKEFLIGKRKDIQNKKDEVERFINLLHREFKEENIDINPENLIVLEIKDEPIQSLIQILSTDISKIEFLLNPEYQDSLSNQRDKIKKQKETEINSLEQVTRTYQEYRTKLDVWEKKKEVLLANKNELETQLHSISIEKPMELKKLAEKRTEICKQIFESILEISNVYKEITAYVHSYIKEHELLQEKFQIQFDIRIIPQSDIEDSLFSIIKHSGRFNNSQESHQILQNLLLEYDLNTANGAVDFANNLVEQIFKNKSNASSNAKSMLRAGKKKQDVYDFLFKLEYLFPEFSPSLNGKHLKRLSPGERGILLLVFYLVVDQGLEPIIIDQPEGNLNNQSIFDNLVPIFEDAKNRRQVIIVTHNPNLAVVCDAEQIIHAHIDFENNHKVHFDSGSLENPKFNKLSLDVLEGTWKAFLERSNTYDSTQAK